MRNTLRKSRFGIIFIIVTLLCCVIFVGVTVKGYFDSFEPKEYCDATLEDDFDDFTVIVVLDKSIGGINKPINYSLFKEIDYVSIRDLSHIDGDIENNECLDKENFHQILSIQLREHSKENVLKNIKILENVRGIMCAGPNYIYRLDDMGDMYVNSPRSGVSED